jgi:hypothetical protein
MGCDIVFLKKSLITGTFLSTILLEARSIVAGRLVSDGKMVSNFRGHGVRNGSSAASSEKLTGERMGSDGTGCTHRCSTLYVQQATVWRFTSQEEKDDFLFQPPA